MAAAFATKWGCKLSLPPHFVFDHGRSCPMSCYRERLLMLTVFCVDD
jgi:hypothetical protein